MEKALIKGKKLQMTQVFNNSGKVVPVTVVGFESAENVELDNSLLNKKIDITGTSKGKGFAGVMKRWNFRGQQATRGQSDKARAAGSIGAQTPGRVFKGKKMAGHYGNKRITVKGSQIVMIDLAKKQLMVQGPVPGARNSEVVIKIKE